MKGRDVQLVATLALLAAGCAQAEPTSAPFGAPTGTPSSAPFGGPTQAPTTQPPQPPQPPTAQPPQPPQPPTAQPPQPAPTSAPTSQLPTSAPSTSAPSSGAPPPPVVPACPTGRYYAANSNTCNKCVTADSPFKAMRGHASCFLPTTLSSKSVACTAAVLPSFIRSNVNTNKEVNCINPLKRVSILLPTQSGASLTHFLTSESYNKASLRLNNSITPRTASNGNVIGIVRKLGPSNKLLVQFDDTFGTLRKKWGLKVRLTGVLNRGGDLLPYCFISYLQVCPSPSG